ncbi:S41 family peptidase [Pedobacter sp. P351]|uniref:S41 family peptidase n=1 Tax=Pedobacter superstes TaxID=3133441 RepID=UPI0030B3C95F
MKFLPICISIISNTLFCEAQIIKSDIGAIKNAGFEISRDTLLILPGSWTIKKVDGFVYSIDEKTKRSDNKSFTISSTQYANTTAHLPFNQVVPIIVSKPTRISISVYIKTDEIKGEAGLWSQVWNKDNKQIGFANLQMQNIFIHGTSDWTKYSINLTVDEQSKSLVLGGYLKGAGTVWYDDFSLDAYDTKEPPSKEVEKYISEVTEIVKEQSIFRDSLNWKQIDLDLKSLSRGVKSVEDSRFLIDFILMELRKAGDNHSFLQAKTTAQKYASKNLNPDRPHSKLLGSDIGYIYIPGFSSTNDTASLNFSNSVQLMIKKLDSENKVKGWIVDLRGNTGGNMWPMVAGLGPLIGGGSIGYFVNSGKYNAWMNAQDNSSASKVSSMYTKNRYSLKEPNTSVAVLIGPKTSSSGEMTAIAFIGKNNTKFIGKPSGGFTTANGMFKLSDGSMLMLATSYAADRNKTKYLGKINPDILVPSSASQLDEDLLVAEKWIRETTH